MAKKTAPKATFKPTKKVVGKTAQKTVQQTITEPKIVELNSAEAFNEFLDSFPGLRERLQKIKSEDKLTECSKSDVLSHKTDSSQMISTNSPVSNKPVLESFIDRLSNSNSYTRNLMHNLCNAIDRITGANVNSSGSSGEIKEQPQNISLLGKFNEELNYQSETNEYLKQLVDRLNEIA